MPTGFIILWAGAIVDIPNGWVLCDGNNGSPDLRNRFIVGAGDTYAPDETGGAVNHDHTFTTDGHYHLLPAGSGVEGGVIISDQTESAVDTGTTEKDEHLPPYYALAYIYKL